MRTVRLHQRVRTAMTPPADPPAPKPPPAPRRGLAALSLRPEQIVLAIGVLLMIAAPLICG